MLMPPLPQRYEAGHDNCAGSTCGVHDRNRGCPSRLNTRTLPAVCGCTPPASPRRARCSADQLAIIRDRLKRIQPGISASRAPLRPPRPGATSGLQRAARARAGMRVSSFCVRRALKGNPLHGHKGRITGISAAHSAFPAVSQSGAGGARTHDRRIMRPTPTVGTSCGWSRRVAYSHAKALAV